MAEIDVLDLAFPATTDAAKLAEGVNHPEPAKMTVVFATYQSIQVVADAQKHHGLPVFDLIICDEAHRTTGATLAGEDESNFVQSARQCRYPEQKAALYDRYATDFRGERAQASLRFVFN